MLSAMRASYEKSPLAEHVVSCNSMGVGCCHSAGGSKCWEYGDAPSGGDRTTAGPCVTYTKVEGDRSPIFDLLLP